MSLSESAAQRLEERIEDLESELEKERSRRRNLERALAEVDRSGEDWRDGHEMLHEALKRWKETVNERHFETLERIEAIERGEIDPGELMANSNVGIDPSELLPLHNKYLIAQKMEPDEHQLSQNQEIAARLFAHIPDYAYPNEGKMILPSTKVTDILEREIATPELSQRLDVEDPNANTVRRAMKFVAKFGKDMIEFDDSEKMNRIIIDRDAWVEYEKKVSDGAASTDTTVNTADDAVEGTNTAEDGVDEEMDRLTGGVITLS